MAGHSLLLAPRPDLLQGETIPLLQGRSRQRVNRGYDGGPSLQKAITRGYSSDGRAPALQAGGQRFDPAYLHQPYQGFHVHLMTARKDVQALRGDTATMQGIPAGVAQSVEQLICNQQVGGSSPSTSSTGSPFHSPALFLPSLFSHDSLERRAQRI